MYQGNSENISQSSAPPERGGCPRRCSNAVDRGDAAHAVDRGAVAVAGRGRCARRALLSHHAPADARPGPDHPWADLRAIGHRGLAQDTQDGSCDGREALRDGRHRVQLHLCPEQAAGLLRRHIISILSRYDYIPRF